VERWFGSHGCETHPGRRLATGKQSEPIGR
jgi:hypothetical protein